MDTPELVRMVAANTSLHPEDPLKVLALYALAVHREREEVKAKLAAAEAKLKKWDRVDSAYSAFSIGKADFKDVAMEIESAAREE